MVRPVAYDDYNVSNYPTGNNAIVCVIAYTVRNGSCQHLSRPIELFVLSCRAGPSLEQFVLPRAFLVAPPLA